MAFRPSLKPMSLRLSTWVWFTPTTRFSIGSSIVMMLRVGEFTFWRQV